MTSQRTGLAGLATAHHNSPVCQLVGPGPGLRLLWFLHPVTSMSLTAEGSKPRVA